jgi:hypothetical protein
MSRQVQAPGTQDSREKCGVEVTQTKVRCERMGHIDAQHRAHIWFF